MKADGIFSVHPGEAEDVEAVVRLERGCATAPHWSEAVYAAMVPGGEERAPGEGAAGRLLLVARRDGEVVGFAVGRVVADEAELESIAVAGPARRQGVGLLLLQATITWFRDRGVGSVELEVRESGVAARRLYEGQGFVENGRRRGYYENPREDAVLMRLALGGERSG